MRRARRVASTWLLTALALAGGCATPTPHAPKPMAPASASEHGLGRDFFARQAVVARFGDEERRFEIALQSRCDELRVVGLTPFGVRLFSAVRSGGVLEVETLGGRELPFAPERVLRDVERTFFLSHPPGEGDRQVVSFAGESVSEEWQDGRLVARRIRVGGQPGEPPLEIHYAGPLHAPGISERVRLVNPVVGYDLVIHNHQVEELECDPRD